MKKGINQIFLLIVIVICVGMLFFSSARIFKQGNKIETLNETNNYQQSMIDCLKYNNSIQLQYIGEIIDSNMLIENEIGNKSTLGELIGEDPILFFKYTELSCSPCIEQEFLFLRNYLKINPFVKIIALSTYEDVGNLYRFKRINKLENMRIYNMNKQEIISTLDSDNVPYYFILDNKFSIKSIFIPDKSIPELRTNYINKITNLMLTMEN